MRKPVVTLLALAVLGLPVTAAHADTGPTNPAADETYATQTENDARSQELAQARITFTPEAIATVFCRIDGKAPLNPGAADNGIAAAAAQFSDTGIEDYWDAYKADPMNYQDDPAEVALSVVLYPGGDFAPPSSATKFDKLRQWRYDLCTNDQFRSRWATALRNAKGKLATGFKPGMRNEAAMLDFYDKKQQSLIKALDDEQARNDHDGDSVAQVLDGKVAQFAKDYDEE